MPGGDRVHRNRRRASIPGRVLRRGPLTSGGLPECPQVRLPRGHPVPRLTGPRALTVSRDPLSTGVRIDEPDLLWSDGRQRQTRGDSGTQSHGTGLLPVSRVAETGGWQCRSGLARNGSLRQRPSPAAAEPPAARHRGRFGGHAHRPARGRAGRGDDVRRRRPWPKSPLPDGAFGGTTTATVNPGGEGTWARAFCYQDGAMVYGQYVQGGRQQPRHVPAWANAELERRLRHVHRRGARLA